MERDERNMQATATADKATAAQAYAGPEMVFSNTNKAGMQGVDKAKVNRVIYEMSKNSSYFKQAQLQDEKLDCKVTNPGVVSLQPVLAV